VRGGGRRVHDVDAKELGQEVVGGAKLEDHLAIDRSRSHGLQLGGVVDVGDAPLCVGRHDLQPRTCRGRRQAIVLHLGLLCGVQRHRRGLDADRVVENVSGERDARVIGVPADGGVTACLRGELVAA
jgi:hypothetical protein